MKVYLSESTFLGLLLSAAEVYKKECLGYLLGYRLEDRFIVEHAFSVQTASRRLKGVILGDKHQKKIEEVLQRFDKLQIIGDFHSHTQFGDTKGLPIPSEDDLKTMRSGNIYLIVAVNDIDKVYAWSENRDGTISGSVGRMFFKIAAYYLKAKRKGSRDTKELSQESRLRQRTDNSGLEVKRAKIYCPFPPGF